MSSDTTLTPDEARYGGPLTVVTLGLGAAGTVPVPAHRDGHKVTILNPPVGPFEIRALDGVRFIGLQMTWSIGGDLKVVFTMPLDFHAFDGTPVEQGGALPNVCCMSQATLAPDGTIISNRLLNQAELAHLWDQHHAARRIQGPLSDCKALGETQT